MTTTCKTIVGYSRCTRATPYGTRCWRRTCSDCGLRWEIAQKIWRGKGQKGLLMPVTVGIGHSTTIELRHKTSSLVIPMPFVEEPPNGMLSMVSATAPPVRIVDFEIWMRDPTWTDPSFTNTLLGEASDALVGSKLMFGPCFVIPKREVLFCALPGKR